MRLPVLFLFCCDLSRWDTILGRLLGTTALGRQTCHSFHLTPNRQLRTWSRSAWIWGQRRAQTQTFCNQESKFETITRQFGQLPCLHSLTSPQTTTFYHWGKGYFGWRERGWTNGFLSKVLGPTSFRMALDVYKNAYCWDSPRPTFTTSEEWGLTLKILSSQGILLQL